MKHCTLTSYIESVEDSYYVSMTRLYGNNSVRRGCWLLEDSFPGDYVYETIVADLIIKNENRIWARYIPRIEKAANEILSHNAGESNLEPDEWLVILEIARHVKENIPNILIVPDGKEF